jgi:hypothetical protein
VRGSRSGNFLNSRRRPYRHRLGIDESLASTSTTNFIVPGTTIAVSDRFDTRNVFNGFDTGLSAQFQRGAWAVEGLAKIAVGDNQRVVDINGSTTVTVPGISSVNNTGGLLALPSNIGHYSSNHVAVIPQFGANFYSQIAPWLRQYRLHLPALAAGGSRRRCD